MFCRDRLHPRRGDGEAVDEFYGRRRALGLLVSHDLVAWCGRIQFCVDYTEVTEFVSDMCLLVALFSFFLLKHNV